MLPCQDSIDTVQALSLDTVQALSLQALSLDT